MKKAISLIIICLSIQFAKSQDTLANFYYDEFPEETEILIKQVPNKNIIFIFGLAIDKLYCLKLDIDNKYKKEFTIPFDETMRGYRYSFFTDTSLIIWLVNKEKNLNTYKLEYFLNIEKEVITKLHINAFNENETLTTLFINNKVLLFQKNEESIVFNSINQQTKTKTSEFNISKLLEISKLKKKDFLKSFLNKEATTCFGGDKNLIGLHNSKKRYIYNDTAYLISNNDNELDICFFDLLYNTYSFKRIDLKAIRNYNKKTNYYYNYCMVNNLIAVTRYSDKDVYINFYNALTGNLVKECTLDSLSSNGLQNHFAISTMLKKDESTPINNINEEIFKNVKLYKTFVSCVPLNQDNFILSSGILIENGVNPLQMLAFFALTAVSLNNPIFTTTSASYHIIPTGLLRPFINENNNVAEVRYFTTSFNTQTLEETPIYKKAFLNEKENEFKSEEKKINKILIKSISFSLNNQLYNMQYLKINDVDKRIVILKM